MKCTMKVIQARRKEITCLLTRFYLLPKINKASNPGRPIVSANGHPTEKISEFVDLHLQPHVKKSAVLLKGFNRIPEEARLPGPISTRHPPCFYGCHFPQYQYSSSRWQIGMRACEEVWAEKKVKDPQTLVKRLTLILKCNNGSSTGDIISKSKALLWVPIRHLHAPTFSWVVQRDSYLGQWP